MIRRFTTFSSLGTTETIGAGTIARTTVRSAPILLLLIKTKTIGILTSLL